MNTIFDRDGSGLEVRLPDVGGLEVRPPDVGGLEVSNKAQIAQGLEAFSSHDGLEVANNGQDGGIKAEEFIEETERKPRRKKLWLILTGVALLLVIVGAVLGGVFGSQHSHKAPAKTPGVSATPEASGKPPGSSDPPPNAVYTTSGIGVTGWWTGSSSFTIRLIYQGHDGDLRLMRYHSGDGKWSTLANLTGTKAKLGTPIAASCFNIPFFFFTPVTNSNVSVLFINLLGLSPFANANRAQLHRTLHKSKSSISTKQTKYKSSILESRIRLRPQHKLLMGAGSCPLRVGKQQVIRRLQHTGLVLSFKMTVNKCKRFTMPT